MIKLITAAVLMTISLSTYAKTVKPIYVVHVNLGNTQLSDNVIREIQRTNENGENRQVIVIKPNLDTNENPFAVSRYGFEMGLSRMNGEIRNEEVPVFSAKMLSWFQGLEDQNIHPEVFILNGHHVAGVGFYSDTQWDKKLSNNNTVELPTRALFTQTLIRSKKQFPVVKRFFETIKLAFIGGCEGLANFEPKEHGHYGRALSTEEIRQRFQTGNKETILGNISKRIGLAYFKFDLAKTYQEFTDEPNEEICVDQNSKRGCETYDVNRILPEAGLWNEDHPFNMPYIMKHLFPNAYGVFGFSTPSPLKPGIMWETAFNDARRTLAINNILAPLLSDEVSLGEKRNLIQSLRVAWTRSTYRLNSRTVGSRTIHRVSGSITPAFPDLDQNGIFAYGTNDTETFEAPKYAPYEFRNGLASEAPIVTVENRAKPKAVASEKVSSDELGDFIKKVEHKAQKTPSIEIMPQQQVVEIQAEAPKNEELQTETVQPSTSIPYKSISGE